MAISPLTITSERERVIDFSKPFLNLGMPFEARVFKWLTGNTRNTESFEIPRRYKHNDL